MSYDTGIMIEYYLAEKSTTEGIEEFLLSVSAKVNDGHDLLTAMRSALLELESNNEYE